MVGSNIAPEEGVQWETGVKFDINKRLSGTVALYDIDKKNVLVSQLNTATGLTEFHTAGKVRSRGVETSYSGQDVLIRGLDLLASVAYTQSKIIANAQNPATVGKYFYRIPLWRADIAATWHIDERAALTLAARYSGRQYNTLTNTDTNPDVFGGTS